MGLSAEPEEGLPSAGAALDEIARDSFEPLRSRLAIVRDANLLMYTTTTTMMTRTAVPLLLRYFGILRGGGRGEGKGWDGRGGVRGGRRGRAGGISVVALASLAAIYNVVLCVVVFSDHRACSSLGLKNQHGYCVCWMSASRKNGSMQRTHTWYYYLRVLIIRRTY